ncbi:MAG TPA: hypothetical protein V6C58_22975 [Allocoleopsis sp.]
MDNNDIFQQAKNGSVTAIIQVLNDKLADSGIRTRAFLSDGVLQLLCEAPTSEQLIETEVIQLIKQILEDVSPANIRRVKINSRIVDEQQLLWLEDITRYPEKLLWSKEITLKKPNIIKILIQHLQKKDDQKTKAKTMIVYHEPSLPLAIRERQRRKLKKIIFLSMSGAIIILLGGGIFFILKLRGAKTTTLPPNNVIIQNTSKTPLPQSTPTPTEKPLPNNSPKDLEPFAQAVRLAQKTVNISKTAKTKAQWLEIAAQWQKASDFMDQVPNTDKRYKLAQDRRALYRKFSDNAQKEAKKRG